MISNVQGVTCARLPHEQRHWAVDVAAKERAVLSEPELLRAMLNFGFFLPNTTPPK
jgi:hypothetical protein